MAIKKTFIAKDGEWQEYEDLNQNKRAKELMEEYLLDFKIPIPSEWSATGSFEIKKQPTVEDLGYAEVVEPNLLEPPKDE